MASRRAQNASAASLEEARVMSADATEPADGAGARAGSGRRRGSRRRADVDRERYPYRMKDLCEKTGLDRQTIHFYIQQGLVPEGQKTGRNMAYYGPEHLERLTLVRRLQTERFLPLKAIRALLEGEARGEGFTASQQVFLADVRRRLMPALSEGGDEDALLELAPLARAHDVSAAELDTFERLGLLARVRQGGRVFVPARDAWVLELWASLRALGVIEQLGLRVDDLEFFERAVSTLFEHEKALIMPRLLELPPDVAADFVERGLPLINAFVTRYHRALVRNFLAALS